jgi:uncharacterized small protein (DUF1192 family)
MGEPMRAKLPKEEAMSDTTLTAEEIDREAGFVDSGSTRLARKAHIACIARQAKRVPELEKNAGWLFDEGERLKAELDRYQKVAEEAAKHLERCVDAMDDRQPLLAALAAVGMKVGE